MSGMPATAAFCTSSNDARPLTTRRLSCNGRAPGFGELGDEVGGDARRVRWDGPWDLDAQRVERGFAADAAAGGGVEVALEVGGVYGDAGAEADADGVVLLLGDGADAVLHALDLVGAADDAFGEEEAGGELEVVAGGAHGDGEGEGLGGGEEADF